MSENYDSANEYKPQFLKGLVIGVLVMLSVGFVLQSLTGISLIENSENKDVSKKDTSVTAQALAPTVPVVPVAPSEIVIADVTEDDWIVGDKNAPITIIEFSDLQCPFCQSFHPTVKQVIEANDGNVRWVYRHLPLPSLHPNAEKFAEAAECVGAQAGNDAFWKALDFIFNNQPLTSNLTPLAAAVDVDAKSLQTCVDNGAKSSLVVADANDATAAGGQGTPFSIIIGPNGETIPMSGAVSAAQLQATIDTLL